MPAGPWKPTNGIKWHRLRLKLTQAELAARIGVRTKNVCAWERWYETPSPERLAQLAEVLGCPAEELLQQANAEFELVVARIEAGNRRGPWPKWQGIEE